jgi:ferric-dicitrate binding protein FerR (iron transport regulator)
VATQVLGTAFLVRHYESDTQVHVAVTEGKVSVVPDMPRRKTSASRFASRFASGLTLTAGQIGDVTDSTIVTSAVSVNDITRETDWLRGRLVFQHIPVSQVLQTLSRWYGYQFRCTDSSLTNQNVTVALDGRSSAAAFAMLEQLLEVSLTVTGDTVMLTPRRSRSTKGPAHKKEYDVWIPTREVGR